MSYAIPTDAMALLAVAEHLQLDLDKLTRSSGIQLAMVRQRVRIPASHVQRLYIAIARQLKCSEYPARIGLGYSADTLGPLGLLFILSPSLQHAFDDFEQYYGLQDHVITPQRLYGEDRVLVRLAFSGDLPPYLEAAVGLSMLTRLLSLIRLRSGSERCVEKLCFKRALPVKNLEATLNIPCEYGRAHDEIVLSHAEYCRVSEMLDSGASLKIYQTIKDVCEKESELIRPLKGYIRNFLSNESLNLESAADYMNVSERYLQRSLKDLNTSFSREMNLTRVEETLALLDNASLSLMDIAEKLGYSDVSAFSRAFKRNFHVSPAKYRRKKTIC
ncbi:helix-turn-helix domain-containing protein [Endozoicomonadaceae bacterium StTr2]